MKAKRGFQVLRVLIVVCMVGLPAHAKYSGGTGEPNDPYQIATASDLIALGKTPADYDKHFIVTADIDLAPNLPGRKVFDQAVIAPDVNDVNMWFDGTAFTGIFDGNGHTISHLTITGTGYLGLFGQLGYGAQVRDVGVLAVSISGSDSYVGGLAGNNAGTATGSCSSGAVNGEFGVGGLVGDNDGYVTQSYSTSAVNATTTMGRPPHAGGGGLVGINSGSITTSYSAGMLTGSGSAGGGLVGYNDWYGSVNQCFWDTQTSGQTTSDGGTGKTTAEMQRTTTFLAAGWDTCGGERIWTIDEGKDYPRLWWENKPGAAIEAIRLSDFLSGTGTEDDPYLIHTKEDLNLIGTAACDLDKHFTLMADLDLSGLDGRGGRPVFNVIGIYDKPFAGVFDGNGHTVSNLTLTGESDVGLFGQLAFGAEVKNLGVVDVNITGSGQNVGGLVGYNCGGTVTQCYSSGVVSGSSCVGGLVGLESAPSSEGGEGGRTIMDCYSEAVVSATTGNAGGLVGYNDWGTVVRCYSTGSVTAAFGAGGLVGGEEYSGSVTGGFWDIDTSGQATSAGGTGLTTAQMQTASTFLDWGDCEGAGVWTIDEGNDYPRLSWEMKAGRPVETHLSEFLTGEGTPDHPYLIYTLEDVNMIAKFPCEQDKHFRLMFIPGAGTPEDPYVIRNADDLRLLAQCPYEQDKYFRLGFLSGDGTPDDPYVIRTAEDLDLLARCPHEQDKHFRLGFLSGKGTPEDPYVIRTVEDLNLLARCPHEQDKHFRLGFLGGGGTQENPYLIHTADEVNLVGMCPYERSAHFLLMADIDLSGFDGKDGRPAIHIIGSFAGVFDGNGHTISHLTIEGGGSPALFGQLTSEAEVKDLGVVDVNITGTSSLAGALVGLNQGSMIRCYSTGAVSGNEYVGGLAGENKGTMTQCYSTVATIGTSFVGGLAGWNSGAVTQCYSRGGASGSWSVGGLAGSNYGAVSLCYSTATVAGAVTAGLSVGGLAGWDSGTLTQCYSAGQVCGRDGYVGGLVGCGGWSVVQCFWDTQSSGQVDSAGGSGHTTAGMQTVGTFLNAGWDFVGETANGTDDVWWIDEGSDYPRLAWDLVSPHDGAQGVSRSRILSWRPGGPGLQHDVYFGEDEAAVASATPASSGIYCGRQPAEMATYKPRNLVWGKTYYWRIDEVNEASPSSVWKGNVWSFTVTDSCVIPDPADGATDVVQSPVLSWRPGGSGLQYDVYLGETMDSVSDATTLNPDIYRGRQTSEATTYTPLGLVWGKTYYWRIDEVNAAPDWTICKGQTWSFTVETHDYPVKPARATASGSSNDKMGPEKTIDGSGLNVLDQHSTSTSQMWLSGKWVPPVWIQYQFDRVYTLDQMWVWNSNTVFEPILGFGAKDVTVEYSLDGNTWATLAGVPPFSQAPGVADYVHNTTVDFGGVLAKFVRLTIMSHWGGLIAQSSLSEVRFFYVPLEAYTPQPASGAAGVALDAVLSWRPGREAIKHEVYMSTDREAVANGTALVQALTEHRLSLAPLALENGKTYYWKVNEVNEAATPSTWEGDVWSFSTMAPPGGGL